MPRETSVVLNLQVLRAVAALAVVWRHMMLWFHIDPGPIALHAGRLGVDVFFVISGFIMFHTTRNGDRTLLQFWTDRVVRIAPLYWIMTLLVVAMFMAGLPASDIKALEPRDIIADLAFLPHIRADGDYNPALLVGWTLTYEMFFYIIFGLTFFLRSQVKALVALTVLFVALWVLMERMPLPFALWRWGQPVTLEFVAGGVLALLYRQSWTLRGAAALISGGTLILAGFAGVCWAAVAVGDITLDPSPLRAATFGPPAVAVVAGVLLLDKAGYVLRNKLALFLGAASYSIYVGHLLVLQYVALAWKPDMPGGIWLGAGIGWFAAVLAGCALYLFVEKPVTQALQSLVRRRRRRASTLAPAA